MSENSTKIKCKLCVYSMEDVKTSCPFAHSSACLNNEKFDIKPIKMKTTHIVLFSRPVLGRDYSSFVRSTYNILSAIQGYSSIN